MDRNVTARSFEATPMSQQGKEILLIPFRKGLEIASDLLNLLSTIFEAVTAVKNKNEMLSSGTLSPMQGGTVPLLSKYERQWHWVDKTITGRAVILRITIFTFINSLMQN